MRRKGMAEPMRMREEPAERRGVEWPPAGREKQVVDRALCELRTAVLEIEAQAVGRLLAEWDDAPAVRLECVL